MIILHHLENSRSQRVLWLLEELGLPYEIVRYQRDPATLLAPQDLRRIHPLGKSPVIVDEGITVAESGAILEYLVERYGSGRLAPAHNTPERPRYTYWMHYAEGSPMPLLLMKLVFSRIRKSPAPFFVRPLLRTVCDRVSNYFIDPQLRLHLDYMEAELAHTPWFAGDEFTAADIQMSFPLEAAASRAGLDASRPRLMDWLQRIHARPAYQRALQRGGPFLLG